MLEGEGKRTRSGGDGARSESAAPGGRKNFQWHKLLLRDKIGQSGDPNALQCGARSVFSKGRARIGLERADAVNV